MWQQDKVLIVNIEFAHPTKIVFPGFIEKLEYLEGVGGITIDKKNFSSGQDSILLTRKEDIKKNTVVYVTVLGKRLTFIIKYAKQGYGDSLVKINIPVLNTQALVNQNKVKKIYKRIRYKDLTRQTNLKSVAMIVKMNQGRAKDYYEKVEINKKIKKNNSFFGFINNDTEKLGQLVFKKLFNGNKTFFNSLNNRKITPLELYEDNYLVVGTNKRMKKLNIYGMKMRWCNNNREISTEINIDDIKTIIGKNILAVKHPMKKIAPMTCKNIYVVFYKNEK